MLTRMRCTLRFGRRWFLGALVVAVAAGLLLASRQDVQTNRRAAAITMVDVAPASLGRAVPPSFLGLSVEWDSVDAYAGPQRHRRAALPALLAPLRRASGAPLALRVGGDTTDQAWWNPQRRARPATVLQDVTPATLDSVGWLARGLGGPVTLGVNLALGDAGNALALARAARRRLPRGALDAVEIGNEPDLYTAAHTFRVPGHVHRRLRKHRSYGVADYGRDTGHYLDVLAAGLRPTPHLAVAGFAGAAWWSALPRLLERWPVRSPVLSAHLYALPRCGGPSPPPSWLLRPKASRGLATRLDALAALARRRGLALRVPELNSAACGGRPGLSDTFGAALWLADTLFALVREGVDQADVHTWDHARYAPFAIRDGGAQARPPLIGMLAFARAAPRASRLVPVAVGGAASLRAWATVDRHQSVRVLLIAPRAARTRVHLGGRANACGVLWTATAWRTRDRRLCPSHAGYAVTLPARSLDVLTVTAPR